MKKFPLTTILTAGALVILFLLYAVVTKVRFNEWGLRVRFGQANAASKIETPDLYWQLPRPFEKIVTYDNRLQVLDATETETKTREGKNVVIGCYALWRVKDPLLLYNSVKTMERAEEQVRARINEVRAAVLGQHDMAEFVGLDAEQVNESYDKIEAEMLAGAAPGVARDYGIELIGVGIRRISLPEQVTQKVFEQMVQERQRLATKYLEEGKARAATITGQADSAAKSIMAFAGRKAKEIESAGVEASTRILQQVPPEDRDFFIWLRQMDALKAALRQQSTIFFDANQELFHQFAVPAATPPRSGASMAPQEKP